MRHLRKDELKSVCGGANTYEGVVTRVSVGCMAGSDCFDHDKNACILIALVDSSGVTHDYGVHFSYNLNDASGYAFIQLALYSKSMGVHVKLTGNDDRGIDRIDLL